MNAFTRQKGFSLLEMCIVLGVMGVLTVGCLRLYAVWMEQQRYAMTKERLEDVRHALRLYVAGHESLPCPAGPKGAAEGDLKKGLPGDEDKKVVDFCGPDARPAPGVEVFDTGVIIKGAAPHSAEIWRGVLPIVELGIKGEQAQDGWGIKFTYAVSRKLTLPQAMHGNPALPGNISVIDKKGRNVLDEADTGRYVIISHGPSKAGGWTYEGGRKPCDEETLDGKNCNGRNIFVEAPLAKAAGEGFYDDIMIHDDLNTGASLLDVVALCSMKKAFYVPEDAKADVDGCVAFHNIWQGICRQPIFHDKFGKEGPYGSTAELPEKPFEDACVCPKGFANPKIGMWNDGSPMSTGTKGAITDVDGKKLTLYPMCMDKSDLICMTVSIEDPNPPWHVKTALYTCVQ